MKYQKLYDNIGKTVGIDPSLLYAIAVSLTDERQDAFICRRGRCMYGVMLLSLPGANMVGFRGESDELMDPETNIFWAAVYLLYLLQQYNYDLKKGLVAYLVGRYDSRYIHKAEKILMTWRRLIGRI